MKKKKKEKMIQAAMGLWDAGVNLKINTLKINTLENNIKTALKSN